MQEEMTKQMPPKKGMNLREESDNGGYCIRCSGYNHSVIFDIRHIIFQGEVT